MSEMGFEEALTRLEEILQKLETGKAPLNESLALFEEGVKLSGYCNKLLDQAEQKVLMFTKDEEGNLAERPFEEAEDKT